MVRLILLILENADFIFPFLGLAIAYLLNRDQNRLPSQVSDG